MSYRARINNASRDCQDPNCSAKLDGKPGKGLERLKLG